MMVLTQRVAWLLLTWLKQFWSALISYACLRADEYFTLNDEQEPSVKSIASVRYYSTYA